MHAQAATRRSAHRAVTLASLLLIPLLAGCADVEPIAGFDEAADEQAATPHVVVAHVDTGINPYHITFRDDAPRAFMHPSEYIEGYPEDAVAINLTFDATDYWAAVTQDCEQWTGLEAGQVYWFPGTKVIGAVFAHYPGLLASPVTDCDREQPRVPVVLDDQGHGTMVASRTAGADYGACPECLLVSVDGFSSYSLGWTTNNAHWIDVVSHSWGPFLPVMGASTEEQGLNEFTNTPALVRAIEAGAKKHLSFWATGNGAATRGGVVGHPTVIDPRMTPSIVMVGGHDSGYVNTWPDFPPHVVSDSCDSWAAESESYDVEHDSVAGGTSGATPFAAGEAAELLLSARRILGDTTIGIHDGIAAQGDPGNITEGPLADGVLTLDEWKRTLFVAATPRPEAQFEDGPPCFGTGGWDPLPVLWTDMPSDYPEYVHLGYGATDDPAMERALAMLAGAPGPDRSDVDSYFETERPIRAALHDIYKA